MKTIRSAVIGLCALACLPSYAMAAGATPPAIEPKVAAVLESTCSLLASADSLSYHAEITFDSVLPSLVKLQYAGAMDVEIQRPNRLALSYQSDLGAKKVWYDGKTVTILDPAHNAYATYGAPDTIDAMLKQANEEKNLTIPLSGFDVSDPCGKVHGAVIRSKYVGLNDAAGVDSDHLAFVQKEGNWQLWVEHGKKPLPRKIVITYPQLPTQPQWEAVFSKWTFDQTFPKGTFEAKIPHGAIKTSFVELKKENGK